MANPRPLGRQLSQLASPAAGRHDRGRRRTADGRLRTEIVADPSSSSGDLQAVRTSRSGLNGVRRQLADDQRGTFSCVVVGTELRQPIDDGSPRCPQRGQVTLVLALQYRRRIG